MGLRAAGERLEEPGLVTLRSQSKSIPSGLWDASPVSGLLIFVVYHARRYLPSSRHSPHFPRKPAPGTLDSSPPLVHREAHGGEKSSLVPSLYPFYCLTVYITQNIRSMRVFMAGFSNCESNPMRS